ncbi:unnamed protein product [Schistosoma rodhaini]|uniref:Ribonuclease P protein component 4 n=1 Tax=Schistosoma rodhaini TaxID=6188 RepID=A0A183RIS2_9TREM|nr:unnamed protein product [Schistosoma rodhaini]
MTKKKYSTNNVTHFSPIHHHMNLLYQQISLFMNLKPTLQNEAFTALLCRTTSQNLQILGKKSQTRLSFAIRRSLCTKCLVPLQLWGKLRVRKRHIHLSCALCNHRWIISYPVNKWHASYSESVLPDSLCCNENIEKSNNE